MELTHDELRICTILNEEQSRKIPEALEPLRELSNGKIGDYNILLDILYWNIIWECLENLEKAVNITVEQFNHGEEIKHFYDIHGKEIVKWKP